jgi:hypothetical protein
MKYHLLNVLAELKMKVYVIHEKTLNMVTNKFDQKKITKTLKVK